MSSLLEQLPKIVADGKREAERIMERLESTFRVELQTRGLVIPSLRGKSVPGFKVGGGLRFRKGKIDKWIKSQSKSIIA